MRKFFPLLFLLAGCASVPPGQTKNINTFARATKTFSATPGYLYENISEFRQKLRLIESSTLFNSDKIIPSLNQSLELKHNFDENAKRVNAACSLIGMYADCLLSLTDIGYFKNLTQDSSVFMLDCRAAIQNYNKVFNKKIPGSIGDFLGFAVYKIGSAKLVQMQKKYLKPCVDSGAIIINDVCNYFNDVLAQNMKDEMASLDKQFDNVMHNFYDNLEVYQRKQNVNPFDYLNFYNPLYIEMKEKLNRLHDVQQEMIEGVKEIQIAHEQLKNVLNGSSSPEGILASVNTFYLTTMRLKEYRLQ